MQFIKTEVKSTEWVVEHNGQIVPLEGLRTCLLIIGIMVFTYYMYTYGQEQAINYMKMASYLGAGVKDPAVPGQCIRYFITKQGNQIGWDQINYSCVQGINASQIKLPLG